MKKIIALLLALVLTLSFAACSKSGDNETTTIADTTVEDSIAVDATADTTAAELETSDGETTVDGSTLAPLTDASGSTVAPTTVEETTLNTKMPVTKDEILKAYTAVVNKVKVDMPAYTNNDWQSVSNVNMNKATYGILNTAAKSFLETKEDSTPGTHGKGTHAKWFAMPTTEAGGKVGCVLTDTSKIESAKCVKSGDNYIITITLTEEKDPSRNMDNPKAVSSWHGKMFDVIDITQVVEYAKKLPGVNADNAYCTFHGTATLKYNPTTNECVSLDHVIDVRVFLGAGCAKVMADYHFYDFKW